MVVELKLTTVNYDGREMGEVAATNLIRQLSGNANESDYTIVLASDLI